MQHGWLSGIVAACLATAAQAMQSDGLSPGIYQGRYICPQGSTDLTLTVGRPAAGQQSAEFAFGGNDGLPSGAYVVAVHIERSGDILLIPQQWLLKPDGYEMVGARLRRDGEQLRGTITNPACREIALRRTEQPQAQ